MMMRTEQEYALLAYLTYAVVPFHPLFAVLGNPKYERVNTDWEVCSHNDSFVESFSFFSWDRLAFHSNKA